MEVVTSVGQPWTSEEMLRRWLVSERLVESSDVYCRIWNHWLKWFTSTEDFPPNDIRWRNATHNDVLRYLSVGLKARPRGVGARSAETDMGHASETTRRRYWRVLERVYEYAVIKGQVSLNPVSRIKGERVARPGQRASSGVLPGSEEPVAAILAQPVWMQLQKLIPEVENDWQQLRDRLVLLLFMDLALTPAEVCALAADDVHLHPDVPAPTLHIAGSRDAQERILELTPELASGLAQWLALRPGLVPKRKSRALKARRSVDGILFVSDRYMPLSYITLFELVSGLVTEAAQQAQLPVTHLGPMVLRNTRIVLWHNSGMDMQNLLKRAGYKDEHSLRSLRHYIQIDPARLAILASSRPKRRARSVKKVSRQGES